MYARNVIWELQLEEGHFVPENIDRELVSRLARGKLYTILRTCTFRIAQLMLPDLLRSRPTPRISFTSTREANRNHA